MEIVIYTKNNDFTTFLKKIVSNVLMRYDFNCEIKMFINYDNDFINIINSKKTKIYFLEMELENKTSGISISKKIRNIDYFSKIIILSKDKRNMKELFNNNLEIYDYIIESNNCKEQLIRTLENAIKIINKKNEKTTLAVKNKNYLELLNFAEILYIENITDTRNVRVYTIDGRTMTCVSSIKNLINNILDERIVKTDKSCIVNCDNIKKISNGDNPILELKDGKIIYAVSRSGRECIRAKIKHNELSDQEKEITITKKAKIK